MRVSILRKNVHFWLSILCVSLLEWTWVQLCGLVAWLKLTGDLNILKWTLLNFSRSLFSGFLSLRLWTPSIITCGTGFPETPLVNGHFLTHWIVSLRISHYNWTASHLVLLALSNSGKACSWWCGTERRGVSQGLIFEVSLVKQAAGKGNPTATLQPELIKSTSAPRNWSPGTNLWPC